MDIQTLKQNLNFKVSFKAIVLFIVLLLLAGNVYLGVNWYLSCKQFSDLKRLSEQKKFNEKVVNFAELFVVKVLKAEKDVSFEDRLRLESTVRDLADQEILTQWENFTNSKTEAEAQQNVKDLLGLLVGKISR